MPLIQKSLFTVKHLVTHHLVACCLVAYCSLLALPIKSASAATDNQNHIVVTIKPLYSLVAHLTDGIETPVLLMKQAQSPHHYNMRPSERRLLANARMIVWIGPQMESYLNKVIQQQSVIKVQALQAKDIVLYTARNSDHQSSAHQSSGHLHSDHATVDPHIWLSAKNAIAISKHISEQLILNDPAHTEKYEHNLQNLITKITLTSAQTKSDLKTSIQPFIAHHDAFQYFEKEHGLNYIDSVTTGEETGTSLKQLKRIKEQIRNNNIQCVVFQPPRPDIINTITNQTTIKTAALDPLGLNIKNHKNAWFEIIEHTTLNFKHCLTP